MLRALRIHRRLDAGYDAADGPPAWGGLKWQFLQHLAMLLASNILSTLLLVMIGLSEYIVLILRHGHAYNHVPNVISPITPQARDIDLTCHHQVSHWHGCVVARNYNEIEYRWEIPAILNASAGVWPQKTTRGAGALAREGATEEVEEGVERATGPEVGGSEPGLTLYRFS